VCIFLICMLCISTYSHGLKQKEKIEKEYLKED
jgi:hypothetical protein